jgi:hypothetical protein
MRTSQLRNLLPKLTLIVSLAAGALSWVLAWWFAMTRLCKASYRWLNRRLWLEAFRWSIIYPLLTLAVLAAASVAALGCGFVLAAFGTLGEWSLDILGAIVVIPILIISLTGLTNASLYARLNASRLNVSETRAFGAYMLAVALANGIFAVFALTYYGLFAGV